MFLFVLLLSVLAAGCGSTAFERPGATAAEVVADANACEVAATSARLELQDTLSGSATLLLPVSELDHRAFADCMRQRGYVRGSTD